MKLNIACPLCYTDLYMIKWATKTYFICRCENTSITKHYFKELNLNQYGGLINYIELKEAQDERQ